jgi:hypothetical protein
LKRALKTSLICVLLLTAAFAQQEKLGGTAFAGGVEGFQGSVPHVSVTTAALPDAPVNVAYSATLAAANGNPPYTWTIAFGSLPTGLSLNSSTGVISGTPTLIGNNVFTVVATDSSSPTAQTATQQLSIAVTCAPLSVTNAGTLPIGTVGTAYSFQFNSQGGLGSVTWAASGLSDLSLSSGGALTGTPTVAQTQTFTVTATDSCPVPQSVSQDVTLTVNRTVQIVTTSPLPAGTQGVAYSLQFAAQGGTAPYTWLVSAGSLPSGLSLSGGGALSGTPTVSGTFNFTVQITDSAAHVSTAPFTLVIGCDPISISTGGLPNGVQNVPYNFQLTKAGGSGAVAWVVTGLPNGLSASSGGSITGTPSTTGSFSPVATVTDSCSTPQSASSTFSLSITTGLTIVTASPLPSPTVGTPYTSQITAVGGVPPYQWSTPAGPIPNGAEDILDYALMPVGVRSNFHLTGTAYKAFRLDAGLIWWLKGASGGPWDGEMLGGDYVYQWFTEGPTFNNLSGYKMYVNPVPLWKRYHVPGADDVVYTPGPNRYSTTESCGADGLPLIDNLGVRGELTGPFTDVLWQTTFGGDIPDHTPYLLAQKWIKCTANSIANCTTEEDYWLVKGWGQVRWVPKSCSAGVCTPTSSGSVNTNEVAGGAPVPNFACKVPNVPVQGMLPPGVTITSAPQMDLAANTGVISGTPKTATSSAFTVQVEDSVGTITQKDMTMGTSCPAISLASTSPLPLATQGQAYNFQFSAIGGTAPLTWSVIQTQGLLPNGITLSSAGVLSGTPTQTGTFSFLVQVTDSCTPVPAQSVQSTFQLSVQANNGPLAISTPSPLPGGTESVAYSTQISATGGTTPYTFAATAGTLPAGLSMSSTGLITGTPTTAGTSTFSIRVTDALSVTATKSFTLIVTCPAQSITSTSPLAAGTVNKAYSFQFASSGGVGAKTWAISAGALPTGMSLSSGGLLSGTPSVSGSFSFTVRVTDSCSPTPQATPSVFALTINPAPVPLSITTSSLPSGTEGVAYSAQLSATGGTAPYTWTIQSGSLPTGLSLSSAGVISGTPAQAGSFTVVYKVTDNVAATATQSLVLVINCPTILITSATPLPVGEQSNVYTNFQFTSSGGILPVTWSVFSGAFPTGLSLSSAGLLSGTPTANGTFTTVIHATDSCSPTPSVASKTFSLSVVPALTISTTSPLQVGTEGQAYSATVSATGGATPYVWSISSGSLPIGLSMTAAGVISGTPTTTGVFAFTVRVTDALSNTTTKGLSITVSCTPISITTTSPLPSTVQNQPYSFQFASQGGKGTITWTGTGIPTGLSLATSGALTGTPTGTGTSSMSITATDQCSATPQTANASFSLTISPATQPLVITTSTTLPAGTQGVAYSAQMAASGGVPGYTWAVIAGSLPAGLSLSGAGVISGTPTTIGASSATIQVTDTASTTASGSFSITISCVPLAITSGLTLPTGTQNQAYSDQLFSSGGTGAKTWSLVSGSFPTGVTLSSGGLISGTPSTSGAFSPQIRVTDSCSTPQTATSTFSLAVNPATVPLQITTNPTLPSATTSTPYSVTLSATGGTPPYGSWTVTVGSLPTGLNLNASTGVISGTPSVAGTSSFTVRVADAVPNTATLAMTLTVVSATGAYNPHCTSNNTITNLPQDGPALPLAACINTAIANTPSSGAVVNVTSGSCASLQSAVSGAVAGQTIVVPVATYNACSISPAAVGNASNWITVRTSAVASLPAEGTRLTPAWGGVTALVGRPAFGQPAVAGNYLPKIISTNSANPTINVQSTAAYWRFIGLEPTSVANTNFFQIVSIAQGANHIIFDRMWINGADANQLRNGIQAGVRINSSPYVALVDSTVTNIGCINGNVLCSGDSQAVFLGGSACNSVDGPIKITNNFLEVAGEGIFSGGGGCGTGTLPASDVEIAKNHIFKPLWMKANDPTYGGTELPGKELH